MEDIRIDTIQECLKQTASMIEASEIKQNARQAKMQEKIDQYENTQSAILKVLQQLQTSNNQIQTGNAEIQIQLQHLKSNSIINRTDHQISSDQRKIESSDQHNENTNSESPQFNKKREVDTNHQMISQSPEKKIIMTQSYPLLSAPPNATTHDNENDV